MRRMSLTCCGPWAGSAGSCRCFHSLCRAEDSKVHNFNVRNVANTLEAFDSLCWATAAEVHHFYAQNVANPPWAMAKTSRVLPRSPTRHVEQRQRGHKLQCAGCRPHAVGHGHDQQGHAEAFQSLYWAAAATVHNFNGQNVANTL